MDERRSEYRELREHAVFIELLAAEPGDKFSQVVLSSSIDRSPSGLQFSVDQQLSIGQILQISVETSRQERLTLVGEVKWCREDKAEDCYSIGFELFDSEGTDIDDWKAIFDSKA